MATFADTLRAFLNMNSAIAAGTGKGDNPASGAIIREDHFHDCLALPKDRDCHRCCAASGFPNRVCSKFCNNAPVVTPHESTP
jgi:hypothetical protein